MSTQRPIDDRPDDQPDDGRLAGDRPDHDQPDIGQQDNHPQDDRPQDDHPQDDHQRADDRPDLAAMVVRLGRALVAIEQPILAAHDVSMWGYIVLTALRDEPTRAQATLARAIGADKTRLIGVLDELQRRNLIDRGPDPHDRRVHVLGLTPAGRGLHAKVHAAIRAAEVRLLTRLPQSDREAFLRSLQALDESRRHE